MTITLTGEGWPLQAGTFPARGSQQEAQWVAPIESWVFHYNDIEFFAAPWGFYAARDDRRDEA